jgi:hypothetical protein
MQIEERRLEFGLSVEWRCFHHECGNGRSCPLRLGYGCFGPELRLLAVASRRLDRHIRLRAKVVRFVVATN